MDSSEKSNKNRPLKPLELTSTTLFRCPISLEVMTSPVSLSTGVTYDRSSIQKWLDSGHRTCPATCQPLISTDLVPNLTLRRLIRLCTDADEKDAVTIAMIGTEVLHLVDDTDPERSESRVVYLAEINGEMKDKVVSALVDSLDASMSALIRVLKKGNTIESRICASRLIETMLSSPLCAEESKVQIIERIKLFDELIHLIGDGKNQNAVSAGIDCILTMIGFNDKKRLRIEMVRSGAIPTLVMVIKSTQMPGEVASNAMRLLEQASMCKEGFEEIIENAKKIIEILTEKMMKVGKEGREAAVGTIWVMCSKTKGDEVREAMKKMNGLVERLLMVMQEDCSPLAALMAGDLLRICVGDRGKDGGRIQSNYTKTMHIMPF